MAIVYLIWVCLLCFSCLLLSRLLCMHPHFLCKIIVSKLKKTPRERASEGASEHNCIKNRSNNSKNRSNKTETQLFGANTKSNENRNNKTETTHIFIRCHFGPLLFALVFAPYILHRCSHLTFIPPSCIGVSTLLCTSDGRSIAA